MRKILHGNLAIWSHEVSSPRARLLLVHGMGEHSARHANTVEALNNASISVTRFDLRGCGESGGRRQWIESFDDYVSDTHDVFQWICRELSPLPLFIFGHSLGGAITIHYASHYGRLYRGVILSAPAFRVGSAVSPIKLAAGKMLNRLAPNLRIQGNLNFSTLSRDPEIQDAYGKDPLVSHFNTVRQGNEILRALEAIPNKAAKIHQSLLIYHGTHDQIIRPEGSLEILKASPSADKALYLLPGVFHEPHNDLGKEAVFELLCRWISQRANSASNH